MDEIILSPLKKFLEAPEDLYDLLIYFAMITIASKIVEIRHEELK